MASLDLRRDVHAVREQLLVSLSELRRRSVRQPNRRAGEIRIAAHGYDEIAEDRILAGEVIDGIEAAVVIEDYPTYPKGPCALVLQRDGRGSSIHVV